MGRPLLWATFYRVDDPFILWWSNRLIYELIKLLTVFGDPSTLWRLHRPIYLCVCNLFTVLGDPFNLFRLYRLSVLVIRPLCGRRFIQRFRRSVCFVAEIPSNLWTYWIVVIRPLCGGCTVQFMDLYNSHRFGDPSALWTRRIIQRFRWSVHSVAEMQSNLWICGIVVIRALCGGCTVQFMDLYDSHRFGDPSALWTCRIIQRFRWSVHFVAEIPSNLWTCWIVVIRPLCGGCTVQFMDF